jgi:serine O-acetyltransferase
LVLDYIKSDLYRYTGKVSFKSFLREYLFNTGFKFCFWLRLASQKGIVGKLSFPISYYYKRKYRIEIHPSTKIGYGLYLAHGGPVVINPSATLGNNVTIAQFSSIGAAKGRAAEIGDNVYIGPNVCIVDHVKIGSKVTIGAGSVVTKDIPDNATAVGNYCKVINYDRPGRMNIFLWPPKPKN